MIIHLLQVRTAAAARMWRSWDFILGFRPTTLLFPLYQLSHLGLDSTSPSHTPKLIHEIFLKVLRKKEVIIWLLCRRIQQDMVIYSNIPIPEENTT